MDPEEEQEDEEEKSSSSEGEGELEDDEADYDTWSPLLLNQSLRGVSQPICTPTQCQEIGHHRELMHEHKGNDLIFRCDQKKQLLLALALFTE